MDELAVVNYDAAPGAVDLRRVAVPEPADDEVARQGTEELRARFVEQPPDGYVPIVDAMRILGVSRQTVLQRVKRGELDAVHVYRGKRKDLRIRVIDDHPDLFQPPA